MRVRAYPLEGTTSFTVNIILERQAAVPIRNFHIYLGTNSYVANVGAQVIEVSSALPLLEFLLLIATSSGFIFSA